MSSADKLALQRFYRPYLSESEDDLDSSGSESESDKSSASSMTSSDDESVKKLALKPPQPGSISGYPVSMISGDKPPTATPSNSNPVTFKQTTTAFTSSKNSTTIMINSSDRDMNVYPQPTKFTIRLPRVYRNVVSLSVTQIKMLSSFYYFTASKNNTYIRVQEYGRTVKNDKGVDVSNNKDVFIRNGTYDGGSLVTELNNQLNTAPIYSTISRNDFVSKFITTGDYSPLFNDPGTTTYNGITGIFENLKDKNALISRYFKLGSNLGIQYYSTNECLVAYYYPMLRDMTVGNVPVVTPVPANPLIGACSQFIYSGEVTYAKLNYFENDTDSQTYLEGGNSYDRIVYSFQGLSDPYIIKVILDPTNQIILEKYKTNNTWNSFLVNNYTCSYDSTIGRLTIYSSQLNASLVTTLNNQYQTILVKELVKAGIDPGAAAGIQTTGENYNGVLIDMYNYIQSSFTNIFGVNYGAFAPIFYNDLANSLRLYDASGRYGWNLTYSGTSQVVSNNVVYPDASGSWSNLVFDPAKMTMINGDIHYVNPVGPGYVRYTYTKNALADASGGIILTGANEENLGYQDISFNLLPTTYTRIKFNSNCRQTMHIETLPPRIADVGAYNPNLPAGQQLVEKYYFDPVNTPLLYKDAVSYKSLLDPYSSDFTLFDVSQNMLDGPTYMRTSTPTGQIYLRYIREQIPVNSPTLVPPPGYIGLYTFRPHVFFQIHHSQYPVPNTDTKFTSDIYIERENSLPFGADLDFYWYRDRAAYMTDVSNALVQKYWFNPKNYMLHQTISRDISSAVITTDFISNETSYGMLIANGSLFPQQTLRIFVLRHDPYGVYTFPAVNDYRRLPVNLEYFATKRNPTTLFPKPFPTLFNSSGFRNSYDLSGVSNDLLNHIILANDFTHYDPYDFTINTTSTQTPLRFAYQFVDEAIGPPGGISEWSQYFFSGSDNAIVDSSGGLVYYDASVAAAEIADELLPFTGISNEYIFANWFRAGATANLYNPAILPSTVPEQTIAPLPINSSPFTVFSPIRYNSNFDNSSLYKFSPFSVCQNKTAIGTDISFNDLSGTVTVQQLYLGQDLFGGGYNITGIIGLPFVPPMGRYITPTKVVLKYAYIQPCYDVNSNIIGRNAPLYLTTEYAYKFQSYANSSRYMNGNDLNRWDDKFYQNRQNLILGIFSVRDVFNKPTSTILISNALCTLSLQKVVQVGQYSSTTDTSVNFTKNRSPEWGTYYVYESTNVNKNMWFPYAQTLSGDSKSIATKWAVAGIGSDVSREIFMNNNTSGGADNVGAYYSDVMNNGLCFVAFRPVLTTNDNAILSGGGIGPLAKSLSNSSAWEVGTMTGLTYTANPYIPTTSSETLAQNPNIIFNNGSGYKSVCIEDVGGAGIAMGGNSTYLGSCGPFCLGVTDDNLVVIPNNRQNISPPTSSFFNVRVNIRMTDTKYNPVVDLSLFGGQSVINNTYIDTQTYYYDVTAPVDRNSDFNDISGGWGMEKAKNFERFDDDSGYNYMSYMDTIDISDNS
jgi:hypothetical protein